MFYAERLKENLLNVIASIGENQFNYVRNPKTDFIRKRKMGFEDVIKFIISMQNDSTKRELMKYFDYSLNMPSDAAFNQQRAKVLPSAFEHAFRKFNQFIPEENFYEGYRLLSCDGSSLAIAKNEDDSETFCHNKKDGYNVLHLNAMYDLLNRKYVDAVIQPIHSKNERAAFCDMVERFIPDLPVKTIFIADRGYACFNTYAHVQEKKMNFLIRTKDLKTTGKLSGIQFPDTDEFDVTHDIVLTHERKRKLYTQKYIGKKVPFKFLDIQKFYRITIRYIRFKIPGTEIYECIATNLPEDSFPVTKISELYRMRWGIETAFRDIKYAVGLEKFHSKKRQYIEQEIWARLILFNFCGAIENYIKNEYIRKKETTKYKYQLNFTTVICLCKDYLSSKPTLSGLNLEQIIRKNILPVRRDRSFARTRVPHKPVSFCYRNA